MTTEPRAPAPGTEPVAAPEFGDPSRRTYLAQERTLLAWWRTGLASIAVGLAVGRLLPEVAHLPKVPFLILGVAYGILAFGLVAFGTMRQQASEKALAERGFARLSRPWVIAMTVYLLALVVATITVMFWNV